MALTRAFCHTSQCKRLKLKSQKEALLLFLHATARDGVCAMKSIVTIVRLRCHVHVIQRGRDTAADKSALADFKREIEILQSFTKDHINVSKLLDSGYKPLISGRKGGKS